MIEAHHVTVSRVGRKGQEADYWLYFNAQLLVELPEGLARGLVYELADRVGLRVEAPGVWHDPVCDLANRTETTETSRLRLRASRVLSSVGRWWSHVRR
ncbi:hypothetical protein ACFY2W_23215 [Streptomyces sp. NPDC001262]|uniref:hypothetical protein n=1 Tax=Streptomyces sp. NPDC001262 TaxID=3364552 RepID=UPI0036A6BA4D